MLDTKTKEKFYKYFAIPKKNIITDTMFIDLCEIAFNYDYFAWHKYSSKLNPDFRNVPLKVFIDFFEKKYFEIFASRNNDKYKRFHTQNYENTFLNEYNAIRKVLNLKPKKLDSIEKLASVKIVSENKLMYICYSDTTKLKEKID